MARSFTGTELIDMAKAVSDHENSTVFTAAQWLQWLSSSIAEHHADFVATGMGYVMTSATITATGAASYALPSDHFATMKVDQIDGSFYLPLEHISELDTHRFEGGSQPAQAWFTRPGNIGGAGTIVLLPLPTSGTYRHTYATTIAEVTSAGTALSFDRGFERIVVLDMAIWAKMKEEVAHGDLVRERDRLQAKFEEVLALVNYGDAPSLVDRQDMVARSETGDYYPRRFG